MVLPLFLTSAYFFTFVIYQFCLLFLLFSSSIIIVKFIANKMLFVSYNISSLCTLAIEIESYNELINLIQNIIVLLK